MPSKLGRMLARQFPILVTPKENTTARYAQGGFYIGADRHFENDGRGNSRSDHDQAPSHAWQRRRAHFPGRKICPHSLMSSTREGYAEFVPLYYTMLFCPTLSAASSSLNLTRVRRSSKSSRLCRSGCAANKRSYSKTFAPTRNRYQNPWRK